MSWKQQDINSPVPETIADVAGAASSAIGSIQSVMQTASSLMGAANALYSGTTDPFITAFNKVANEIENAANDLFSTGVYMSTVNQFDIPGRRKKDNFGIPLLKPREALELIINSFDDQNDPARPIFSDAAQVAAFGFIINAPDITTFMSTLNSLLAVFHIPDWAILEKRYKKVMEAPSAPSVYPDWQSLKLDSIEQLKMVHDSTNRMLENIRGNLVTADSNIAELTEMIGYKIDRASSIINQLDEDLANLKNAAAASGVYYLNVPLGAGGNKRLKDEIFDCDLCLAEGGYTAAAVFVGGGPSAGVIDMVRGMLT